MDAMNPKRTGEWLSRLESWDIHHARNGIHGLRKPESVSPSFWRAFVGSGGAVLIDGARGETLDGEEVYQVPLNGPALAPRL